MPTGGNLHALEPEPDRSARIDAVPEEIRRTLDVQVKRIAAIQAQLDHLSARSNS
jgi:hypothetical protein